MDYAIPILVCHQNEDFRFHLREMLSKHGFFHVLDAGNEDEIISFINTEEKFFAIVHMDLAHRAIVKALAESGKKYIFISQPDSEKTMLLASQTGVHQILSFPFSSQQLVEKIIRNQ
jgi:DNA-binding response OmpR family regulator